MKQNNDLLLIELDEESIESMIYEIRGERVMLNFDLARIYGYSTRALNQQVQRNIEKFPEDFMFKLNSIESEYLVMSKKLTSRKDGYFLGQSGGTRKLPYAFTEKGIYMLMTALRGELAIKQSVALIRRYFSYETK